MYDELVQRAKDASRNAYAPYSHFPVGSAVLLPNGEIIDGCNVENASYGLTMCAERVAIGQAIAHGHTCILAVAVYTPTPEHTAPCGACRQVINEFGPHATIICACDGQPNTHDSMDRLLPKGFGPGNLIERTIIMQSNEISPA